MIRQLQPKPTKGQGDPMYICIISTVSINTWRDENSHGRLPRRKSIDQCRKYSVSGVGSCWCQDERALVFLGC